jgi:hypothetical protein
MDVMKAAFVEQGEIQYTADTFDTTAWDAATLTNTASIGLSVQSDKGIIEEIIEPITVSLQGIVDVLGDGRISFRSRDPEAPASRTIYQDEIIGGPNIEIQTDEVVSDIQVSYSPSFIGRNVALTAEYSTGADAVTAAFAIKSTQPISPVQTVLTEEADALAVGAEVASTSQEPQEIVSITIPLTEEQIQLLEVVQVNVGRPHKEDWRVYEVLERSIGLQNSELAQDLLLRRLPGRVADFSLPTVFDEGLYSGTATETLDGGPFSNDLIDVYYDEGTVA